MFRRLLPPALLGLLLWLLWDAGAVQAAAREALGLCARSVIPALLPFLVVTDLLLSLCALPTGPLSGLMALYGLPGCAASALVLGLVGGYPVGARTAAQLYEQGRLTRPEAERLLTFCSNSNPVFLLSVLGGGVFHSLRVGVWLWLIHLAAALVTGLLFRGPRQDRREAPPAVPSDPPAFLPALAGALSRGGGAMVSVCACVVCFYVLLTPLRALEGLVPTALIGLVELFSLVPRLTPDAVGLVLASGCGGWGGLSVLAQSAAVLRDSGLSLRPLVRGKLVQGLLAALLAGLLAPWLLA